MLRLGLVLSAVALFTLGGCGTVGDSGVVSETSSTVSALPLTLQADGITTATITVTLRDAESAPVMGKAVSISSSRGSTDNIAPSFATTDAVGVVTFTIKSSTEGTAIITATDTTDSLTVAQTAIITFTSVATAPAPPTGLIATAADTRVSLSWTTSASATSYTVLRSTTSGSGHTEIATVVSPPSYTDTSVTNGTTYYYVVRATNAVGTSGDSAEVSATPAPATTAPSAPTGLAATAGDAQVALSWSGSAGATSYTVRRSTSSGSGFADIATGVATTAYVDATVTNGTTYYYVVRAVNAVGTSPDSNEVSATPMTPATPPAAPTGLAATAGNGQVSLTWSGSAGATSYTVRRSTTSGSGFSDLMAGVATTSFTDTTAVNGTTYYYVVRAVNAVGASGDSNQVSATPNAPPAPPTGLAATAGNNQVALTWNASSGATSYNVRRSTTSGSGFSNLQTGIGTTSFTDTTAVNGTRYYYTVRAVNAAGTSGDSNEVNATPMAPGSPPAAPTGLTATPGNAQVQLSWTASTGATSYSVRRGTTSGSYSILATNVTTTSYLDTTVTNGTRYYYVVFAVNSFGSSGNSTEVNAMPLALVQRANDTFRTFSNSNSSGGAVPAATCATMSDYSCHAVDGNSADLAHAWTSTSVLGPYLQVDTANNAWGKTVDHFTLVYQTSVCSGGNLQIDYQRNLEAVWMAVPGSFPCVAGVKTTLDIPLGMGAWAISIRNNSTAVFTIFEIQFWTTN